MTQNEFMLYKRDEELQNPPEYEEYDGYMCDECFETDNEYLKYYKTKDEETLCESCLMEYLLDKHYKDISELVLREYCNEYEELT